MPGGLPQVSSASGVSPSVLAQVCFNSQSEAVLTLHYLTNKSSPLQESLTQRFLSLFYLLPSFDHTLNLCDENITHVGCLKL